MKIECNKLMSLGGPNGALRPLMLWKLTSLTTIATTMFHCMGLFYLFAKIRDRLMNEFYVYLPGFAAAYSILLMSALSPGPSVAILIGIATGQGRAPAMIATLGIALGSATINVFTMLGVGLILSEAAWLMSVLRIIGATYLFYLAYGAFKKAIIPPSLRSINAEYRSPMRCFTTGYLVQASNPKGIAFWLAIASVGATEGAGAGVVILFVIGAFLISFSCHGTWAIALSTSSIRSAYFAGRRWIEITLGSFLVFAAYKFSVSS